MRRGGATLIRSTAVDRRAARCHCSADRRAAQRCHRSAVSTSSGTACPAARPSSSPSCTTGAAAASFATDSRGGRVARLVSILSWSVLTPSALPFPQAARRARVARILCRDGKDTRRRAARPRLGRGDARRAPRGPPGKESPCEHGSILVLAGPRLRHLAKSWPILAGGARRRG